MSRAALLSLLLSVPLVAAEPRPMTVDDVMKLRNVLDPRISPDGGEVAYVVSVVDDDKGRYDSDIWLVDVKTRKPIRLTRNPGRDDSPRWSPDGRRIAFVSDRSGSAQVWVLDRAGGEPFRATAHPTPVVEFAWSPDGASIAFLARDADSDEETRRKRERGDVVILDRHLKNAHLHLVDLKAEKSRRLTEGRFHIAAFSWSPDGKRIAYASGPSASAEDERERDIHLLNLADGKATPLVKRAGLDASPRFSPDGKHVAFLTRNGSTDPLDDIGLAVVSVEGGTPRGLSASRTGRIVSATDGFEWGPESDSIRFTATDGTVRHLCSISLEPNAAVRPVTAPSAFEDRFTFSRDGKTFAHLRESPKTITDVWIGGALEPLTDANPQMRDVELGAVERMRWKSKDGLEIEGLLVKPVGFKEGKKVPTLVYVHGGPAGQFMQSFALYSSTIPQAGRYPVQVLAGEGYAVFCPNPRGSGSQGAEFRKKNVEDWGGGDLDDILSGLDVLVERGIADPDRLGIMGWSYGGYMTAWTITQTTRFKAASFGAGLTNLSSFYGQTDIPGFLERYWGGPPWKQKELYAKRSAMTFVDKVKTPTLIQHGERDERVPLAQSQELYAALKRRGVPTEMAVYPRQGHNVLEPKLQRDVQMRNVEWFNRWLKK